MQLHISQLLMVEGTIHANGNDGHGTIGGGSGGGITVHAYNLEGSGNIEVKGGTGGSDSGAGGGGRLTVYYQSSEYWFGTLNAKGGAGSKGNGGAGIIYLQVWISTVYQTTKF